MNHSNSGILDVQQDGTDDNSDNDNDENSNALSSAGISNASFVSEMMGNLPTGSMTESMAVAKNLLDEVKDPLGISDSLYQ